MKFSMIDVCIHSEFLASILANVYKFMAFP